MPPRIIRAFATTRGFDYQFSKLPPKEQRLFEKKLLQSRQGTAHPQLHDHTLHGRLAGYRAFSVSGKLRVIYHYLSPDCIRLISIGSHDEVYC